MKSTDFRFGSLSLIALTILFTFSNCKKDLALNQAPENEARTSQTRVSKCLSTEKLDNLLHDHPEVQETRNRIEAFTTQFVKDYDKTLQTRAVINIPVVVHVVYNTTAQNISDQQIYSQIDILNKDFRKINADAANVPSVFRSLAADVEINFCLAQQDPIGRAATGIVRKQTSTVSYDGNNDNMMAAATGGSDIWDRNRYLNIYVCNLEGFLGYAYSPGGPANIDAVVIGYTCFGTTGTVTAPYNLGRTATHEVGHWLNLDHIWGGDGSSCTDSDNVADTPNQGGENYGVPTFPHISCGNTPNGDMFMNYMDYCDDRALTMFSLGQKARMQALFGTSGARRSLLLSNGCNAPSLATCSTPVNLSVSNITATSATLNWGTASSATSYTLQYKTTSGTTWSTVTNITGTSYNLTGLTAITGYQFKVLTVCSSGSSAYSSAVNFTTLTVPSTGCTDNYESNNTSSTAKTIPVNTNITAKIGTATDVDWFSFTTTTAQPKIKIDLTNLPFDYDVYLYRGTTLVGVSENEGSLSESIILNNGAVGTYRIKVVGYGGVYSNSACYTLRAQIGTANFRLENVEKVAASAKTKKKVTMAL